jgi:predicted nucleic acid-binding Zn ribbon protein
MVRICRMSAHMRMIEAGGAPRPERVGDGTLAAVCGVCGKTFRPRRPATACSGRCRALRSRETRRSQAISRLIAGENALLQGAEALRAVRKLLEGAPEGILAVPVSGGVR